MESLTAHPREIAVAVGAVVLLALLGGFTTEVGAWYEGLRFPWLRPPNWLFAPAWTLIFALIASAGVMSWLDAPDAATRKGVLGLFALNWALNAGWSPLFFKLRRPDWAFAELIPFWLSIAALILYIEPFSPRAAAFLAPYLAWVTFAGWLNWQIVKLNRPFGRSAQRGAR